MSCPHKADDCPAPYERAAAQHIRCRTCTRCHANRATAMASFWCPGCLASYVTNRPVAVLEGASRG